MATTKESTTLTPRHEMLLDILTTALEGGIGYWCCVESVERAAYPEVCVTRALNPEDTDDGSNKWLNHITPEIVELGMRRINEGSVRVRSDIMKHVNMAWIESSFAKTIDDIDALSNIDAEVADCIVQAGLLGEIVYG